MMRFKECLNEFPHLPGRIAMGALRDEIITIPFFGNLAYELRSNASLIWRQ